MTVTQVHVVYHSQRKENRRIFMVSYYLAFIFIVIVLGSMKGNSLSNIVKGAIVLYNLQIMLFILL